MLRALHIFIVFVALTTSCAYAKVTGIHIKIPITFTDSDSTHVNPVALYFGVDPQATDCVDSSLGENVSALQCGSPNQNCAKFQDPSGRFSSCIEFPSFTDLRKYKNLSQVDEFKITFSGKYPITIRWPNDLSSYYDSVRIYDNVCGCIYNVDMRTKSSLVISASTVNSVTMRTVGPVTSTDVNTKGDELPMQFRLSQNFPNPFNPTTTIQYSVNSSQYVSLKVYDMFGREITELVHERKAPGNYEVRWNADGMPSGLYFYRLTTSASSVSKKMALIR